jgi:hypothetical protein
MKKGKKCQKFGISEEGVKLESREINGFISSKCFMTPEAAKMSRVTSRKDIITQNCSVKKRMSFLQYELKNGKKLKQGMRFFSKHIKIFPYNM